MKLRVWKWYHNWGDDSSTHLYASEAAAWQAIHSYVQDQWNEEPMDDEKYTGNREADVQKYFEWHDDCEWYSLDFQEVEFPNAALAEDEVILSANECAVVVAALEAVNTREVAGLADITPDKAARYLDAAYQKLKD